MDEWDTRMHRWAEAKEQANADRGRRKTRPPMLPGAQRRRGPRKTGGSQTRMGGAEKTGATAMTWTLACTVGPTDAIGRRDEGAWCPPGEMGATGKNRTPPCTDRRNLEE
jgi:hypothetical protein